MNEVEYAIAVVSSGPVGQDRVAVFFRGGTLVAVVADGAGGTSGGAEAAEFVVEHVRQIVASDVNLRAPGVWRQVLLEASLAAEPVGQTTAVVYGAGHGASIGDSAAWLIKPERVVDLTAAQPRKPLLGGGLAEPATFNVEFEFGDVLLIATDGLFKYLTAARICELARQPRLSPDELIQAARLPSGDLQDDVGIVMIRPTRSARDAELRKAITAGASDEASLKRLERLLEDWMTSVMVNRDGASDGVIVSVVREQLVAGVMWRLEEQTLDPFELYLRPDGIELLHGDAQFPAGLPNGSKRLTFDTPRDWAFRELFPTVR